MILEHLEEFCQQQVSKTIAARADQLVQEKDQKNLRYSEDAIEEMF